MDAQRAEERLVESGIARSSIRIVSQDSTGQSADTSTSPTEHGGILSALTDFFMPDEDRHTYEEGIRRGGHLLSADVDESNIDEATRILDAAGAVDLESREVQWRNAGWMGHQGSTGAAAGVSSAASTVTDAGRTAGSDTASPASDMDKEAEIPIVEEQLRVGKRDVNRGGVRVRSYIVETPVHEQVRLRNERVQVERRPVNQPLSGDPGHLLQEREFEVTETDEEPVVAKEAVVREELVVRKDTEEHVENVDDTVRRTEVDVQDTRGQSLSGTAEAETNNMRRRSRRRL